MNRGMVLPGRASCHAAMRIRMLLLLGLLLLTVAACGGDRDAGADLPQVSQLPPPDDDGGVPPAGMPAAPAAPVPVPAPAAEPAASAAAEAVAPPAPVAGPAAAANGERDGWNAADYAFLQKRIPLYEQSLNRHLDMGRRVAAAETLAGSIEQRHAAAGSAARQAQQLRNELQTMQQQLAALRGTDGAVDLAQFAALDSRLTQLDQKLAALDGRVQRLLQMRVSPQSNWPR